MANPNTGNPYNAAVDANQYPTIVVVSGTAGTNDVAGTAEVIRVGGNPATGAIYVQDLAGASGTTNIQGSVLVTSIAAGTQNTLGTVGTVIGVGTLTNLGSQTNLGQIHNAGTLQAGTVQINKTPVTIGTAFHTRGTTGAAVWGTLIAASGAGTRQYISNIDIVVVSGTVDVAVTNIGVDGSAGAGVLARGQFVPSAGITKQFDPVTRSGTNGTLSFWLGGAGTIDINIHYWQGV